MKATRRIFIDEFAINTAMTRAHARAPRGERAEVSEPGYHEPNTSVIGALSLTGINALMTIEGAVDTQVFDLFVEHFSRSEADQGRPCCLGQCEVSLLTASH
jgi:hypothetical protein